MRLYSKGIFVVLLCIYSITSFAQTEVIKQPIFKSFPTNINLDNAILVDATKQSVGSTVDYTLGAGFKFNGTVKSNEHKYNNLQIIVIRSSENVHTFFQISKIINTDNTILYKGRILNTDAADGYEVKNNNGVYTLQKFETNNIFTPCKY